jgi:salicylate hydroxylase
MRKFLHEVAIASGATVHLNTRIRSLDFETPSLKLENGETVTADLIIAADGKNSAIRQTMFPGSERELTDTYVFQANIPREAMYQEDYTKDFYNDPSVRIYLGPSQWSFISPAPNQDIYDMQFVSRDFGETGRDPKPERELETLENLDMIGDQVDKWNPEYKGILAKATTFFKWRVALAPEIPTALAKGGKVVLIGDACHGIDPSMGFGSALSLEDGVAIAATLRRAPSKGEIPTLLAVFDEVMRARAGIIGRYSTINGALFGIPDGEFQQRRDAAMKVFDPNGNLNAEPNAKAKYGTSEYQAYLDDYDPEKAVEEALRKHAQENALPPGSVASRI